MSKSIPPPSSSMVPPTSSGAPYIIAIVALAAVIGGMLFWKLRKSDPPPAPPKPVVSAAPKEDPGLAIDLPPPPPIVASAPAAEDGGKKAPSGGGSLCGMKCENNSSPATASAVRGAAGAARGCYERALRTNAYLQGGMKIGVKVAANGQVCSASIVEDTLHSGEVSNCVLGLFRGKQFPPPTSGCVEMVVPVSFSPQEGKK